jgi:YidC/Oxa1 family membrane protein insertase
MSEQRNLIMAIVFSMVILLGWQFIFPPETAAPEQQAQNQQAGVTATGEGVQPGVQVPGGRPLPALSLPKDRTAAVSETARIKIETPRLTGSIRVAGARIDDLTLTDYRQTSEANSPSVELLNPAGGPSPYFAETGWLVGGGEAAVPGPETVWSADSENLTIGGPVRLTWDNGQGLQFVQEIQIDENYMFTIAHSVESTLEVPVTLYHYGRIIRRGTPDISDFYIIHEGPLGVFEEKVELDYSDLRDDGDVVEASPGGGWLGVSDKYWMTALIPEQSSAFEGHYSHRADNGVDRYQVDFLGDPEVVAPGTTLNRTTLLFAGAKEVKTIAAYEENLGIRLFDKAIDWGWFEFLTRPFFHAIDFFFGLLGNFGLAIISVTVVVKFLFLPLAWKSYVSMAKMRALQPEIVKLRERAGDDRMKMQQDMMALYKKNKVNPVSGCLPILLQIPVFFALYKVLFVTIEMRHKPFYGWIEDLAARDPTNLFELFGLIPWDTPDLMHLGVWPILMGISMFAQQKINPQPPDPMQARIMMMLPIVFTFFLARFPAGLVIYWTANNLLSIAQQYTIMRITAKKAAAVKTGD